MAALTPKRRDRLPDRAFAIPERRAYPIDTRARAISALSRVKQHGSNQDKHRVRAAVHRRYPDIEITGYTTRKTR